MLFICLSVHIPTRRSREQIDASKQSIAESIIYDSIRVHQLLVPAEGQRWTHKRRRIHSPQGWAFFNASFPYQAVCVDERISRDAGAAMYASVSGLTVWVRDGWYSDPSHKLNVLQRCLYYTITTLQWGNHTIIMRNPLPTNKLHGDPNPDSACRMQLRITKRSVRCFANKSVQLPRAKLLRSTKVHNVVKGRCLKLRQYFTDTTRTIINIYVHVTLLEMSH